MEYFNVAVLGSASINKNSPETPKAFTIGRLIAQSGGILFTGGCGGLPHAASLGARTAGGLTVAVSPAMNEEEHVRVHGYPADAKVAIYTGLGKKGRNVILVRSARICVFLAGGMGTLNEFTIAHDELSEKCVIAVLSGSGGFSDEYLRLAESSRRKTRAALIAAHDPEELVHKSVQELFR